MLKLLKDLGKDEQSVTNLTKFINKTKENDLKEIRYHKEYESIKRFYIKCI